MRSAFLSLLILATLIPALAQKNLSGSKRSSEFTYIYKITPGETKQLFKKGMKAFDENKFLHTLLDSFKTITRRPAMKPGNYLLVHTKEDGLQVEQYTAGNINCKVMGNYQDLQLHIHNSKGQPITDAAVKARNRKIPWDAASGVYRSSKVKRKGIVEVTVDGVLYCYSLRNRKSAILPAISFKRLFKQSSSYYNDPEYFRVNTKYESRFTGFMVFSKPMYKPKDTVKFKAWIMPLKGKPVNRPLILRLTGEDFYIDTILATLHPYRPGAYEYSFVLNDSLDLDLDEEILLTLEEESSRKFDLETYEGDLEEDEYAMKRQVLMRNKFRFEEYELGSVTFSARTDREKHNLNTPLALYVKAVNENDMTVMDGRVRVIVSPASSQKISFHRSEVFLKDTLWVHEQAMDPVGQTKILLPDSIFPSASFSYSINAIFLNSNNEREQKYLTQQYIYRPQITELKQERDSLQVRLIERGQDAIGIATIFGLNETGDTIQQRQVDLPAQIKIDPYISRYYVIAAGDTTAFPVERSQMSVACNTLRTRDSVFIQLQNPCRLPGWYTIFEGNKVFQQGRIDSLFMAVRTSNTRPWFVSIQYVVGDRPQSAEYTIPYEDKKLNVQLHQPEFIYPGQRTTVQVDVKDLSGKPVADADITLFGYTSKFRNAQEPSIPDLSSPYKSRKLRNRFFLTQNQLQTTALQLNWEKWSQRLGLDSIEYYRFLYPDSLYVNYEPAVDSVTQIAPFVVSNGKVQAIQMLYIDDQPYFFKGSQHWQQYSFAVSPGIHSIKLRIHNKLVYSNWVMAQKGVKTIVSLNANAVSSVTRFEKMPETMTGQEQQYWNKYLILVEQSNTRRYAWVQTDQYFLLSRGRRSNNYQPVNLIGPVRRPQAIFTLQDKFKLSFEVEGGYQYRFEEGLIKMKQWPHLYKPYNPYFYSKTEPASLLDQAITGKVLDSLWLDFLDHRNATEDLFHYGSFYGPDAGRLRITADTNTKGEAIFVKNVLLFKNGDPDFLRVYKGNSRDLGSLRTGKYRILLLLRNDQYFLKEQVLVKPGGINYFNLGPILPRNADSMSRSIAGMINNRDHAIHETQKDYSADTIKSKFNQQYFQLPDNARTIFGQVTGDGQPLPGVTVILKNTSIGTITDANGNFTMKVPDHGMLRIAYIGYGIQEISLDGKGFYEIRLNATTMSLNEVVVVGYGAQAKRSMTGAVTSITTTGLSGRVAGVISIRGNGSVDARSKPLIVVDGLPVDMDIDQFDRSEIATMEVLKADKATALWGARAASGVILITTKKTAAIKKGFDEQPDQSIAGNSLRTNFKDEAYWFPAMRTNQEGKTSVSVVFPDDITNWKTYAIAATVNRETGLAIGNIKSFKAISATLHLPNFAVSGDEMQVLGKAMNYGLDSLQLKRQFLVNGKELTSDIIGVKNSRVDSFPVMATGDTMKLAYTIQRNDGYFDGEERKLTVFRQGVTETNGIFAALYKDSLINWQPSTGSEVTLHAEASVLPVLLDEMDHVYRYEYACNEQLASKLKALLMKRKVYALMKKDFDHDKQIRDIISQLNKSKATDNLWGWWKGGESQGWISLHVVEALLMAEEQHFNVTLNKSLVSDYIVYSLDRSPRKISEMLPRLRTLKRLDSKILFKPWLDSLLKHDTARNLYETLSLFAFQQELEPRAVPDSLIAKRNSTVFGNIYWGKDGYRFFDNSIQNTLLMYKILKAAGNQDNLLQKIRHYFLEKRNDGHWRNTYESILILEAILPDLLKEPSFNTPSSLVLRQGSQSHTVSSYPFTVKFNNREPVLIEKKGALPVYLTAYQQKWNPAPEKVDSTFSVSSCFTQKRDTVTVLKGGEPSTLRVNVKVTADASYVMLEIPIPAGCSYDGKPQSWYNNEVHREYFLNKVSIFCTALKKGNYNFSVPLLPRYTGKYNLNPAAASMMYFPVFFGREGMKKVNIR